MRPLCLEVLEPLVLATLQLAHQLLLPPSQFLLEVNPINSLPFLSLFMALFAHHRLLPALMAKRGAIFQFCVYLFVGRLRTVRFERRGVNFVDLESLISKLFELAGL